MECGAGSPHSKLRLNGEKKRRMSRDMRLCSIRTRCAIAADLPGLYESLGQHRVCYFYEAGDVGAEDVVALVAVFA